MRSQFLNRSLIVCFIIGLGACMHAFAQDKDWRPVTSEELSAKAPLVEPGADAEALFWDVRVDDSSAFETALKHYVRVKIFTEHGREQYSKYDIQYSKNTKIKDVEARVTKPDGTVLNLNKDDVLEREVVKANGLKIKAKSFALPGLEVGSILEYRYKEIREGSSANMPLIFQREIPIQNISFYVRPFANGLALKYLTYNVGNTRFEKDKNDFYRATMTNVPAFHEEPSMLPVNEVRSWMYIFYQNEDAKDSKEYWKSISKAVYEGSNKSLKPNGDVESVTQQVVAGAATDDEKLHKIFDYTKTQIRNLTYSTNVSDDDWKRARSAKSGGDVLKIKMGGSGDIDTLFGSMARAAGFDVRLAFSGDRSDLFFNPNTPNFRLMLGSSSIAVKVGQDWKFFSPAEYYTPYGMLGWVEENQQALITDPKELIWQEIPLSPAERSMEKRSGKFKLLEDGSLEGEARIEYTGHRAALMKARNRGDSDTEKEKNLKELIKANIMSGAEVEKFTIENADDPEKPFVFTFKIRVPDYASKTGKRIFFQPNVFERSSKPRFISNSRKYEIYINYPYSEQDDITIELPAGFSLENADGPAPIRDQQGIGDHKTSMQVTTDGRLLTYKRKFSFGNGGHIRFPVVSYPVIKTMFEAFNKADVHQLTLKQNVPPSSKP